VRTEDGYIIHKCLNGESEAFGFLVDKYKESIYGFAYAKLLNFHDAEDVTQEVFIKAYQKLRTLRRWDNFHAWLYSITSNLCKMWLRARSRRPDGEFMEDKGPEILEMTSIDSYREGLARESLYDSLQEALESLPEMYRQVLTLYYLSGMNYKEIARFLGASPMTVLQRLHRARSKLKEEMLAMMNITFGSQKLSGGFTFRILEAVKRIKVQPVPRMTGLPWGLSLAAGIILTVLSLNPRLSIINSASFPTGSPLPVEAKVMKTGEIPVDILKISRLSAIASKQGDEDSGVPRLPEPPKVALMAPHGEGDMWAKKADMPTARGLLVTSVVNGKIYAIGGGLGDGPALSAAEEYNPATDTWTKKTNMPKVRQSLSASTVNGKIYVIGGWSGPGDFPAAVEEYDPAKDKWTKKADMPRPRSELSTSVVDGKIYVTGGGHGIGNAASTVEEYDPEADKWIKKADMPKARQSFSTSVVNGKIYAIGGEVQGVPVSTVEEYDPVTDTWTKKADMPTARLALATSVVNGKIYAIGGAFGFGAALSPAVEEYDPETDAWTKKSDMPAARGGLSTSVVNGKIYAIGGAVLGWVVTSAVEEYNTGFAIEAKGKLATTWGEIKPD
jgi:RNA polymerase sigma factor (sigma-70 family)